MANKRALLTGTIIRREPVPSDGYTLIWDTEVPGYAARITAGDVRSLIFNYRTKSGRERRITLARWPETAVTDGRRRARALRHTVDSGGDPQGDNEALREAATMADLFDRFEAEHLPRRKASTQRDYKSAIDKYLRPYFKAAKVADVTFADCDRLHHRISAAGHRRRANTTIAILSKAFSLAARWGLRTDGINPCRGIERHPETKRHRYLSGDELRRLSAALSKHDNQQAANIVRLCLFTGCRRSEATSARWATIDLRSGVWSKRGEETKQGTDHIAPLNAPARQLLSEIYARQTAKGHALPEYVFPSRNGATGHITELKRSWRSLCRAAGIEGLRLHDLRHHYASEIISGGASLAVVSALLGHADIKTSQRYAHLYDDALRRATEKAGRAFEAAANGDKPAVPPTPLPVGRRGGRGR
jgi:integrase